jgi:hypothetical protein
MSHWRSMFDNKYLGNWDLPEGAVLQMTGLKPGANPKSAPTFIA